MQNMKVIFWLICFFPIGLYFMFKETDWSRIKKIIIAIIGTFALGYMLSTGTIFDYQLFSGLLLCLSAITYFIYAIIRRKKKRSSLLVLLFGILLLGVSTTYISVETAEAERIAEEQKVEEQRIEEERVAEEQRLEQERLEKEKQDDIDEKTRLAEIAIKRVEQSPTRKNAELANKAIAAIPDGNQALVDQLLALEPEIEAYELALEDAISKLEVAEESNSREDYEAAVSISSTLSPSDSGLTARLSKLDTSIAEVEAQQAEEERQAQEAEENRIAQEKADQEAAQKKADEEKAAAATSSESYSSSESNGDSNNNSTQSTTPNAGGQTYVQQNGEGAIKGSVNGIYHIPGSTYYGRTKNVVQWFKTAAEAEAAGYRAPER
ncbi:hypothetical protein ACFP65_08500 [Marinilactibacillus sp. GCM10026970]|uniref:sunset domain-containing protein n=1 Tax=Marinilactibacillus sp. GCM10026970 TaxID=3252642 RepID=UPI0036212213